MKKCLLTLLFVLALQTHGSGQWYVGDDAGILSFDLKDEIVSSVQFEDVTASLFNLGVYHPGEKNYIAIRYGKKETRLQTKYNYSSFQDQNYVDAGHYELTIEYMRRIVLITGNFAVFGGVAHNGHFTYLNHYLDNRFINTRLNSHEMAMINFSLKAMLRYKAGRHQFYYKAGYSVANFGSRPSHSFSSSELNLRIFLPGEYADFQNSLSGYIRLSDRFLLKPEYRLRFFRYEEPRPLKLLKQSFLVGIYFRL